MKAVKELILIGVVFVSVAFAGYVIHGSGYMAGESAGHKAGLEEGFKAGRVYQATVTPVIIKEVEVKKPTTIQDLDELSPFDIYDYLKARNARDRKRWSEAQGKTG